MRLSPTVAERGAPQTIERSGTGPDNRPSRALSPANWHSTTTAYLTGKDSTRPARAAPAHQFGREPYDVLARADEVDRVKVAMSRDIPRNPSRGRVWVQVIGVGGLALFFLLRLSI